LVFGAFLPRVQAFPPAPHHILYGLVRNQWGDPINVAGAEVFLETTNGTGVTTTLSPNTGPGVNYELLVPMDSATAPDLYQPTALKASFPFRLRVKIGQTVYLPIEMAVSFRAIGQPAQSTRLDLTLGEDADGDGLPDAWERALIAALGGNLTLADIRPNDDSDGDGISNLNEYLAGTYPFDPADGFSLSLVGFTGNGSLLEFLAIRGRTYSIESSSDLRQWTPVQFRVTSEGTDAPARGTFLASDVRLLRVEVPFQAGGETNRYFKARVQ
jgi:Bacterial TSP3 repeat